MALTVGNYVYKRLRPDVERAWMNVGKMEVIKPLIAEKTLNKEKRIVQVTIAADLEKNRAEVSYSSFIADGKDKLNHARCMIDYEDVESWLASWGRSTYLIRSRIQQLEQGALDGHMHKIHRGLAYKLFGALVEYEDRYRGMEEVILDSAECEATARVSFQATEKDGNFFCSPYWIDSICHLSGFVMNANDAVDSKKQVYISHGWDSMRFSCHFSPEKTYRSYVKMQPLADKMVAGDVYVFDEDRIVAVAGGVKFQCIPRTLLNTFLPPGGSPQPQLRAPATEKPKSVMQSTKPTMPSVLKSSPSISARALTIVAAEVGVEAAELTDDVMFVDIGIDSLLSLTISGRMREELDLDVPSSLFSDCLNVKELKAFLSPHDANAAIAVPLESLESGDSTPGLSSGTAASPASEEAIDFGAPEDDGENLVPIIQGIIAGEMGVGPDEVSSSADLASMGMDSLMSLSVLGLIREKTGMNVPSDLFAGNACVEEVQWKLQPSTRPKQPPAVPQANPKAVKGKNVEWPRKIDMPPQPNHTHAQRKQEVAPPTKPSQVKEPQRATAKDEQVKLPVSPPTSPSATSILMQGNPKTASKKLFLFPDGSGSATSYASIPPVDPDVCVYGLNCPYMKTPEHYTCGIDGVSTFYITEMRRRQPQGPYIIGGWSAGGVVAYEVALKLHAQGQATSHMILLDSPCPIRLEALPSRLHNFFNDVGLLGAPGTSGPPSWLLPHFESSIRALSSYKPARMDPAKAPKTYAIWARQGVCGNPEDPRPPPAEDGGEDPKSMRWLLNDRTDFGFNGWEALLGPENIRTTSMQGNHFTMMREPTVRHSLR